MIDLKSGQLPMGTRIGTGNCRPFGRAGVIQRQSIEQNTLAFKKRSPSNANDLNREQCNGTTATPAKSPRNGDR